MQKTEIEGGDRGKQLEAKVFGIPFSYLALFFFYY
jgi:hypothetical protein